MTKITELDKKILFELDKDGRASYSEIARNIGTTPQVVKYHFQGLMDNEAIKHFWAFVDYDRVGYSFFWGYWLKFSGLDKEKEEEMYEFFVNHKYIAIVMRSDGYADAMLGIIAKDVFHHNKVLKEVFNRYGKYITKNDIVVGLSFVKFPRSYLINEKNNEEKKFLSGGTTKKAKLTEVDRKIISLLQIDGRMEFNKMAEIIKVSTGLVHNRYKKLVEERVITKTTFTLNHKRMNLNLYRVLFKIEQFNQERIEEFFKFCVIHSNINNYVKTMGNWDAMIDFEVKSREELRDVLRKIKHDFRDLISQVAINEIYKLDKFTQMVIEYPELLDKKRNINRIDGAESEREVNREKNETYWE